MGISESALETELEKLQEAIRAAELEECRNDLSKFASYVMRDEYGRPWQVASHQREWFELLVSDHPRILIVAPRGHAKTTSIVSYLLWVIGRNPQIIIKYVCGNDDLAVAKLGFIRKNLLSNERYLEVFPHIRVSPEKEDEDTKHKVTVERPAALGLQDPTLQAFSVFSAGTGGRAHLIVFDDIINPQLALDNPAMLPKVQSRVEQDWLKLLYPGGRAIMIGTFWSFDPPDVYVNYSRNPRWVFWSRPACYRTADNQLTGPVLWPEVWSMERLEEARLDGEAAFRQQHLLEGVISPHEYFPEPAIQRSLDSNVMLGEGDDETWPIFVGVDPAASLKRKGSFNAIVAIAVRPDGTKLVKELHRLKDTPEGIARFILDLALRYEGRLQLVLVENNAYQEALISLIRALAESMGIPPETVPLQGHFTGTNKWSLDTGLPCIAIEMQAGKWIFPYGGDHKQPGHHCPMCDMVKEMRAFPFGETKDMIMGLLLASTAANKVGRIGKLPVMVVRQQRSIAGGW